MQDGRVARCGNIFYFVLEPLDSHGLSGGGGNGYRNFFTLSGGSFGIHASRSEGRVCGEVVLLHFFRSFFTDSVLGEGTGSVGI